MTPATKGASKGLTPKGLAPATKGLTPATKGLAPSIQGQGSLTPAIKDSTVAREILP